MLRPSPYDQWVGIFNQVTRLRAGSLTLRPIALPFGNSRPSVARTPLPRATGVYGQFPGRDSNPLDQTVVTAYGQTYTLQFRVYDTPFSLPRPEFLQGVTPFTYDPDIRKFFITQLPDLRPNLRKMSFWKFASHRRTNSS